MWLFGVRFSVTVLCIYNSECIKDGKSPLKCLPCCAYPTQLTWYFSVNKALNVSCLNILLFGEFILFCILFICLHFSCDIISKITQKHSNVTHAIKTGQNLHKIFWQICLVLQAFLPLLHLKSLSLLSYTFTKFHPHLVLCVWSNSVFCLFITCKNEICTHKMSQTKTKNADGFD